MTDVQLGTLKRKNPRDVWKTEAQFSDWLAGQIGELSKALQLEIELTERERTVGSFAVDIFGKEVASGAEVVIENQLEMTDHGHLGQLLTYAAGLEANIVIWISPRFRDEHRQAIDWLNRRTPQEMAFFAVELELLQIDDSVPAPHFKVVAEPSEFQKEVASETRQRRTEREIVYHDFFTAVLDRVTARSHDFNVRRVGYTNWLSFSAGRSGFQINPVLAKGDSLRVELYITTGHVSKNHLAFEQLQNQKQELEAALGERLDWEILPKDRRIFLRYPDAVDPANPPDDALDWAAQRVIQFRQVFGPRIKGLQLDDMPGEVTP